MVRFCFLSKKRFRDITETDFSLFVDQLGEDVIERSDGWTARGANTVNTIIATCLRFLEWYQARFSLKEKLVGDISAHARITLLRREVPHFTGKKISILCYPSRPSGDPPVSKQPMPEERISAIWEVVYQMAAEKQQAPESEIRSIQQAYLYCRRVLTLKIAEETGLRPGELCLMNLEQHKNIVVTRQLLIPTLKRRESQPYIRTLPCTLELASSIKQLIDARYKLLSHLPHKNKAIAEEHQLLLITINGGRLTPDALEREFSRLVARLNLKKPDKACLSMYRHRFITRRVAFYIKSFKVPMISVDIPDLPLTDNMTILGRVAELTGHKSLYSLRPYIALGWKELNIFADIEDAISANDSIRAAVRHIETLSSQITDAEDEVGRKNVMMDIDIQAKRLTGMLKEFYRNHSQRKQLGSTRASLSS
ncbi:tyrosine-type recombinase/integrase [Paraburkholderia sp. BR13444]|uniref:tyrosine-type recombinase/integrase n=1 Tax=Paraburkholderia sp. BR13444 TaxID=3236997 RepID=UPI0034CF18F8